MQKEWIVLTCSNKTYGTWGDVVEVDRSVSVDLRSRGMANKLPVEAEKNKLQDWIRDHGNHIEPEPEESKKTKHKKP